MAASLGLTRGGVPDGPARFEPRRDLRAVVDLLRLGFGSDLAPQDLHWLDDLARISGPSLTLQSMAAGLPGAGEATGQVFYEKGQLVGNVSAFRCGRDVWVLANVVTHPSWRGQGIATRLLRLAIQDLGRRGAQQIQLQVRTDNSTAQRIYVGMGFWRMASVVSLRLPALVNGRPTRQSLAAGQRLRAFNRRRDKAALRRLLSRSGDLDRGGPTGQLVQALEQGLVESVDDWLAGRQRSTFIVEATTGPLAVGTLLTQGRRGPHRLELAADPDWTGRVEGALLDALLAVAATAPPQDIEAEVQVRADGPLAVLTWAGFHRSRTLDRLALDL